MENHGKSWYMMIKHGNTWFIHGKSWSIMINYGHLWTSMDIYGHHAIFFPWTNHGNTWRIHGKMIESPRTSRRFTGDSPATRWHPAGSRFPGHGQQVVPKPCHGAGSAWDVMVCPESRWWFSRNSEIGNLWKLYVDHRWSEFPHRIGWWEKLEETPYIWW